MHLRNFIAIVCIGTCLVYHAKAQQDTTRGNGRQQVIDEVVVTGQYMPNLRANAVQKIEVIDRKKIDAMAAQNLRDVLTNQLDIRLTQDPIFGSGMNMQGSKAYGADAKILIDGVPIVGKQNGSVDLAQINLANIERIEIITGPMSVSYGTDAIAGTVNLITRKVPKNTVEAGVNAYYESIGTYNTNIHTGFRKGKHALVVDGGRNFFGGWNPLDKPSVFDFKPRPADSNRVHLWKPREQYFGNAQYTYTFGKISASYKGSYFYEVITGRGTPQLPYNELAFDNYFHTYRKDNAIFVNGEVAKNKRINILAAFNAYKRIKNEYATDLTSLNEDIDPLAQDTSKYNELNSRGIFSANTLNDKFNYEVGYDINVQFANSTQIQERKQEMGNYAIFASAEYRPFTQFTIRPGVRYGYNTRYDAPVVPSLNLMYKAGDNWTFRTSYAKGFRQPGLKELYFDFVDINHNIHGNTDLQAEYSNNYSMSVVYSGRHGDVRYKINASSFYNDIQNLISLASVANGGANEYTYVNIGRYRTKGGQVSADITLKSLSISVGGTYNGTYNNLSETSAAPSFSYSPEVRSSVMYAVSKYGISAAVFYKYTGRFLTYIVAANGDVVQSFMAGYNTADLTVSKQFFSKRVNISTGCKNLFDVKNIAGSQTGGVHASGANTVAVGTGRYFFLKTDINISKQ